MKKLRLFGLIGAVLMVALVGASGVWASPEHGGTVPPPVVPAAAPQPACAKVGVPIKGDLPIIPGADEVIAGRTITLNADGDPVDVCFEVHNDLIGFAHELVVKIQIGGRWLTIPTTGLNVGGNFYRCFTANFGGDYYLVKP